MSYNIKVFYENTRNIVSGPQVPWVASRGMGETVLASGGDRVYIFVWIVGQSKQLNSD